MIVPFRDTGVFFNSGAIKIKLKIALELSKELILKLFKIPVNNKKTIILLIAIFCL